VRCWRGLDSRQGMRTAVRAVKSLNKVGGLSCVVQLYQEWSGVDGAFAHAI
jgi:hypothetical protein